MESFLAFITDERGLSANTLSAYRNDLRQFEEYLGSERASSVAAASGEAIPLVTIVGASGPTVADFFLALRERSLAPATIARKMAAVKSLYLYLHRTGAVLINPTALLGSPEVKKPLPRAISVRDIALLIGQAGRRSTPEGMRDAAMLQLLCATGMRVSELVSLEMADLNLDGGTVVCHGRSGRRRELPIGREVVDALTGYLDEGRPRLLRQDRATEALFLNHRGQRLTRQGFWLIMKALARDSGVTVEVTPHSLRHSFAAQRLRDGLELDQLRALLGHANISTTQIYTQVAADAGQTNDVRDRGDAVGAGS